jgi:hypothetical protein
MSTSAVLDQGIAHALRETGQQLRVDAVLGAFAGDGRPLPVVRKLAVRDMPGSATPAEQLWLAGIDRDSIAAAAMELTGLGEEPG